MDTFIHILIGVGILIGAYQFLKSKGLIKPGGYKTKLNPKPGGFYRPMNFYNHEDDDIHNKIDFQYMDDVHYAAFGFNKSFDDPFGVYGHRDDE